MWFLTWVVLPLAALAGFAWAARAGLRAIAGPVGAVFRAMPLTAAFGLAVILLYAAAALAAPAIAPYGEFRVFDRFNLFPGEDPDFLLGTDRQGRDQLTRLLYGGRNTIAVAFAAAALACFIGGALGFAAAALGGWPDRAVSRLAAMLAAIPQLVLVLPLLALFGQSTLDMVLAVAMLESLRAFPPARAVGGDIAAARRRGGGRHGPACRKAVAQAAAPLLAAFGRRFRFLFLLVAALGFLGVGIQPPLADWGAMAREHSIYIGYAAYGDWQAVSLPLLPAAAVALLAAALNFTLDWMPARTSRAGPAQR